MKKQVPTKLKKSEYTFDAEWLEGMLQAPLNAPPLKPYYTEIKNREGNIFQVLIRSIKEEEIDTVLGFLKLTLDAEYDFYDIVGARTLAELLALKRKRMKDQYFFIGLHDGKLLGIANGRLLNEDINISLHTITFERQIGAGGVLFYAKAWYAFEVCNQQEFWATFESYSGWVLGGLRMALPTYPWPEYQHELGGAKIFYLSRKQWEDEVRDSYLQQVMRGGFFKEAPEDLIKKNENLTVPDKLDI